MDISKVNSVYFLGIGGIGMSALARYFLWLGKNVAGYDRTETEITRSLEKEGAKIHYNENISEIPAVLDLVIYTPAIPATNREFEYLRYKNIAMLKRAEVLGMISEKIPTIAVAGTHGKTTVTSIIAHIFKYAGKNFSSFMGGISVNYNTNFLGSDKSDRIIVEADEFDRSFLHLNPQIGIITSIDADHLDVYGNLNAMEESFSKFAEKVHESGRLILHESIRNRISARTNVKTYGISQEADFRLEKTELKAGRYLAHLTYNKNSYYFEFGIPGRYNLENAVAASAASLIEGISWDEISKALASYKGVKRRFEVHINRPDLVYIDDYAHHPNEIIACVKGAREFYPGKKITGIFQPHLYSRTRDLAEEFAEALSMLDQVILLNIYPARELPLEGVSSDLIFQKIAKNEKLLIEDDKLIEFIGKNPSDVIITMGAGDIERFATPLKERLIA